MQLIKIRVAVFLKYFFFGLLNQCMPRFAMRKLQEEFEDTKGPIIIRKSKDRQHNGQKKKRRTDNTMVKRKRTHNDVENKTKDRVTRAPPKTGGG
jgi:hypothetical protein